MAANASIARDGQRLAVSALGSFNLGLTTLLGILALHLAGGLDDALGSLNTVVGLVIYAVLWAVVTWGVGRGMAPLDLTRAELPTWGDTFEAGTKGGALSGVVVAGGLGVLVMCLGLVELAFGGLSRPSLAEAAQGVGLLALAVVIYSMVGGLIGFAVGAAVGAALALLDRTLLGVARALEGGARR